MKHIIIWIFLIECSLQSFGQLTEPIDDLEQQRLKYWFYRERLKNDFLLGVGSAFGESIPASFRHPPMDNNTIPGSVNWGDATIDLAEYIAVLASEFKLLSYNNQSTYETLRELYYAIEAFNRLDLHAETYDFNPAPCCSIYFYNLNGFFVRNDVGRGLFVNQSSTHSSLYNYYLQKLNNNDPIQANWEVTEIKSEWINFHLENKKEKFFESIDQAVHLLAAFSYVKELLDPWVTWTASGTNTTSKFMGGTEDSFHEEAKIIIKRIIDYMHDDTDPYNTTETWEINRAITGIRVQPGADCYEYAYGLSKTYNIRTGEDNPDLWYTPGPGWQAAIQLFSAQWNYFVPVYVISPAEAQKFLSMVVSGNCYNASPSAIYSKSHAFFPHNSYQLPGEHAVLNNKSDYSTAYTPNFYESMFLTAPCFGPFNYGGLNSSAYMWSSTSLTIHPESRGNVGSGFYGEYNGLDYMLIYNLNELNKINATRSKFDYNHYNAYINTDYPHTFLAQPPSSYLTLGNNAFPFKANAYNNITAVNEINPGGDVYYRAASVDLSTGFNAKPGSEFVAIADNVECAGNTYDLYRNGNTNTGGTLLPADDRKSIPTKLKATLFPVPSSESLNLKLDAPEAGNLIVELFDAVGKKAAVLYNAKISAGAFFLTCPVSYLPNGIYQCIISINKERKVMKINISK